MRPSASSRQGAQAGQTGQKVGMQVGRAGRNRWRGLLHLTLAPPLALGLTAG